MSVQEIQLIFAEKHSRSYCCLLKKSMHSVLVKFKNHADKAIIPTADHLIQYEDLSS